MYTSDNINNMTQCYNVTIYLNNCLQNLNVCNLFPSEVAQNITLFLYMKKRNYTTSKVSVIFKLKQKMSLKRPQAKFL